MKTKLATLALFLSAGMASADVTVTGTGKVSYLPNQAQVSVGVSADGKTAAEAWHNNAEVVKKLFQVLKEHHIGSPDVKTAGMNISPKYIYPKDRKPQLVGYTVTYNLEVTVRQLDELSPTLDALVANGANRGMGITFTNDNLDSLLDQARIKAVADARHKAEIYTKGAGANLGAVLSISEGQAPVFYRLQYEAAKAGGPMPIAVGQQELTVNVTLTYTVENN